MPSVTKPQISPKDLDLGLATTLGVVALFVIDRDRRDLVDLITGLSFTIPSAVTVVNTPEGPALNFNNIATAFSISHPAVSGLSPGKYVLVARARPTSQQSGGVNGIFGVSATSGTLNGGGVGWDNTAVPKAGGVANGSGGGAMEGTRTTGVNVFSTLMYTGEGGVTPKTWCDGTPLTGQFDVGGTLANVDKISFGSMLSSSGGVLQQCKGDLLWAALIKSPSGGVSTFKDAQAWNLYANDFPYNLFRRSRRPWRVAIGGLLLSGVAAVAAVGNFVAAGILSLTGVNASAAAGSLAGNDNLGLTGVNGAGVAGVFGPNDSTALTGVSAAGTAGTFGASVNAPLTGVFASAVAGALSTGGGTNAALLGVAAAAQAGSLTSSLAFGLVGVSGSAVSAQFVPGIRPGSIGVSGTALAGNLAGGDAPSIAGVSGLAVVGAFGKLETIALAAATAAVQVGAFSNSGGMNTPLPAVSSAAAAGNFAQAEAFSPLGAAAAAVAGSFAIQQRDAMLGVSCAAAVGQFGLPGNDNVSLAGVFATGAVGVWHSLPVSYTPVTAQPRIMGRFPGSAIALSVFPSPRIVGRVMT